MDVPFGQSAAQCKWLENFVHDTVVFVILLFVFNVDRDGDVFKLDMVGQ